MPLPATRRVSEASPQRPHRRGIRVVPGAEAVRNDDEYGHVWTAVSRPPWLFALALWPNPAGTWPGGGRFSDDRRLTVMTCGNDFEPHSRHPPPRGLIVDQRPWRAAQELPPPRIEVEGAQWSGRDPNDRLIFARDGKLFRRINGRDRELI